MAEIKKLIPLSACGVFHFRSFLVCVDGVYIFLILLVELKANGREEKEITLYFIHMDRTQKERAA